MKQISDIIFQPCSPSMLRQALEIWNQVIADGLAFVYDEPYTEEEFAAMAAAQTALYCAMSQGQLAGFYILHPNFPARVKHIGNASYAVHPGFRGRGIGRLLAEHSLAKAKGLGFDAMQFNAVVKTNKAANHLWQSLGFNPIGEVPAAFRLDSGEKVPLVLYYKKL